MSDDDLRARLREEMSAVQRPPLAELVESAVARGHHVQRRRRMVSGLGVVAIAAAAAAISLGGQWSDQDDLSSAEEKDAGVAGTDLNAQSRPTAELMIKRRSGAGMVMTPGPTLTRTAAPDGVPATPEGLLELLTRQLKVRTTDHAGEMSDGLVSVQLYVETRHGMGILRAHLFDGIPMGCRVGGEGTCEMTASGDRVMVLESPGNCLQTTVVEVIHSDGSGVQFDLRTCLEWNGKTVERSLPAVTVKQAIEMGKDTRMHMSMDPELVSVGARRFPSLRAFG